MEFIRINEYAQHAHLRPRFRFLLAQDVFGFLCYHEYFEQYEVDELKLNLDTLPEKRRWKTDENMCRPYTRHLSFSRNSVQNLWNISKWFSCSFCFDHFVFSCPALHYLASLFVLTLFRCQVSIEKWSNDQSNVLKVVTYLCNQLV